MLRPAPEPSIKRWLVAHRYAEEAGLIFRCDVGLVEEHLVEHPPDGGRGAFPVDGSHVLGDVEGLAHQGLLLCHLDIQPCHLPLHPVQLATDVALLSLEYEYIEQDSVGAVGLQ